MSTIFKLPDLGEGLPDAEIHEWHVKVGDDVKVDQLLVSMETAKAVVDVPSPRNGRIAKLYGNSGDTINTGQPLVEYEDDAAQPAAKTTTDTAPIENKSAATVAGSIKVGDTVINEAAAGITPTQETIGGIRTLPIVRLIAQKLGVDLTRVPSTGHLGQVSIDDLCQAIKQQMRNSTTAPSFTSDTMKPLKGVRKAMVNSMAESHATVVPVTLSDKADLSAWAVGTDFTTRLIRAICAACKVEPVMNALFDGTVPAIDIKSEVNLGLAVDTPDGLFVPVIKQANTLSPSALREIINRFKTQARDRSIPQDDLRGATITLSNFGTFAGYFANPVVVPPMVTIIGAGRGRDEAVPVNGHLEIHRILPLSVTFDHRAATGGEASRFLKAMIDDLEMAD
ncbi:MAG: dihydrolipoamide acetyltransferase family protein [Gammaproteobacteria bacterium]